MKLITSLFFFLSSIAFSDSLVIEAGFGVTPSTYWVNDQEKSYLTIENELFTHWDFAEKWSLSGGATYSVASDEKQSITTDVATGSTHLSLSFQENHYRLSSSLQLGQDIYKQDNPSTHITIPNTDDLNKFIQLDLDYQHFFHLDAYFISLNSGFNLHQNASESTEDFEQLSDIYDAHFIDQWKNHRTLIDWHLSSRISRLFLLTDELLMVPALSWHYALNIFERNQSLFESRIQGENAAEERDYQLERDFGAQQNTLAANIQLTWRSLSASLSTHMDIEAPDQTPFSLRCYWQYQF
ncbi:MAG: hypothetical protein OXE99_12275 [Cellvibrionales bacterium]|nr:hypothetical protein [Cellvibrionales bacterium]